METMTESSITTRQLVWRALRNESDRLTRAARSRKWAGPQHRAVRAAMREEAQQCNDLAGMARMDVATFIYLISNDT